MTDQKLTDELEKALRDEAYDGGFGYMGDEQFTAYVRTLAVTAAKVVKEAHTPTDDERDALVAEALRPMTDLDVIHDPAVTRAFIRRLGDALDTTLRRTEVPEPSTEGYLTNADLDRFEAVAQPIYRSTREAAHASKFLVSDFAQWIVRLVAEVRRLRTAETEDERIDAWHYVADHEAFKSCYDEEQPLIDSVLARITQLHELESTVNELAPAPTLPLEPSDATESDLIAWHVEQVEALRPFTRSSHHIKAAMMHAATVRALRAAAEAGGEGR